MKIPNSFIPDTPDSFEPDPITPQIVRQVHETVLVPNPVVSNLPAIIREIQSNLDTARGSYATLFPGIRATHIEKQLQHKVMQYRRALEIAVQEFAVYQQPRRMAEIEESTRLNHAALVQSHQLAEEGRVLSQELMRAQTDAAIALAKGAVAHGMDITSYAQTRVAEEASRIKVEETKALDEAAVVKEGKMKAIEHEFKQKEIEAEVDGELRLANTEELLRAQQVQMLLDYGRKLETATTLFDKEICLQEIQRLKGILYGEPSAATSETASEEDPGGGGTPPQSGGEPSTLQGKTSQSGNPDARHVN